MDADHQAHKEFLEAYYGRYRSIYDITRRYYLFGRDRLLSDLLTEPWSTLVEVGSGTGRNLAILHKRRPDAALGGVDACENMLATARRRLPGVSLHLGFAETTDLGAVHGRPPNRVLFAYTLSMIDDWRAALARARRALAPHGAVIVVDFGDMDGLPAPGRAAFAAFLRRYHVNALRAAALRDEGAEITRGPLGYYVIARFRN